MKILCKNLVSIIFIDMRIYLNFVFKKMFLFYESTINHTHVLLAVLKNEQIALLFS